MKIGKYNFDFWSWTEKAELVELDKINPQDDPVRPELDNNFRTSNGRKIYGLKNGDNIEGVICVAYTKEIPTTEKELELMSVPIEQSCIAIAYTVWSLKKGAGRRIVSELLKFVKTCDNIQSIVTLSPLTPMATHFHIRNGAKLIKINPTTQNFEYK